MIDANISEGFTSAIESKNNIKNSLISLGIIFNENDNFSTYSTKITENLMSKSEVNEGKGKIAVAITNKGVETSSSDSFEVMAENINKIEGGSISDISSQEILEGTSEILDNNKATSIQKYLFYQNLNLKEINLPNVTEIGVRGFFGCTNLAKISLPKLTSLGSYAINSFTGENLTLENLTTAAGNNFSTKNAKLISFNFPKLSEITGSNFMALQDGYTIPETIDFLPELVSTKTNAFYGTASTFKNNCKNIVFPKLKYAYNTFFGGTSTKWNLLETVNCPSLQWWAPIIPAWITSTSIKTLNFSAWYACTPTNWSNIIKLTNLTTLNLKNLTTFATGTGSNMTSGYKLTEEQASLKNTSIETLYLGTASPDTNNENDSNIYKDCNTLKYLILQTAQNPCSIPNIPQTDIFLAIVYLSDYTNLVFMQNEDRLPANAYVYVTDRTYEAIQRDGISSDKFKKISENRTLLQDSYKIDLSLVESDNN